MILLGNLSIKEIEERVGIKFDSELVEYMTERRQEHTTNIKHGQWHCFDIPFTLVCGDIETATYIYNSLSPFTKGFKAVMQISITPAI